MSAHVDRIMDELYEEHDGQDERGKFIITLANGKWEIVEKETIDNGAS